MARRQLTGTVVSKAGDQTIIVRMSRQVLHRIYRKRYTVSKKLAVHDPDNKHQVGETVTIEETRPLSARKRFIVVDASQPEAKKTAKTEKAA